MFSTLEQCVQLLEYILNSDGASKDWYSKLTSHRLKSCFGRMHGVFTALLQENPSARAPMHYVLRAFTDTLTHPATNQSEQSQELDLPGDQTQQLSDHAVASHAKISEPPMVRCHHQNNAFLLSMNEKIRASCVYTIGACFICIYIRCLLLRQLISGSCLVLLDSDSILREFIKQGSVLFCWQLVLARKRKAVQSDSRVQKQVPCSVSGSTLCHYLCSIVVPMQSCHEGIYAMYRSWRWMIYQSSARHALSCLRAPQHPSMTAT